MRSWCAAVTAAVVLAGCSSSGDDEPSEDSEAAAAECVQLDAATLEAIAGGLKFDDAELDAGQAVELPAGEADLGISWAVAVRATTPDGEQDLVLGMGAPEPTGGPIIAADNVARVFFDWGEAASDDSPMGQYRDGLFLTESADAAVGCL